MQSHRNNPLDFFRRQPLWRYGVALAILVAGYFLLRGGGRGAGDGITFAARQGPLDISVLEGGSVQALESQEIKCEVRVGYQGIKILKMVEEGYQVTDDDIRTNKVLVELDSSDLQKQLVQQEIQYQSATASLTDAQQGFEIQLNQNLSDIKAAEQKAKFARMDFDKYLGDQAASAIIAELGIEQELLAEQTNLVDQAAAPGKPAVVPTEPDPRVMVADGGPTSVMVVVGEQGLPVPMPGGTVTAPRPTREFKAPVLPPSAPPAATPVVDFSRYADINILGDGEAKQKLRELEDGLQVARKEMGQAQSTLDGTKRLFEKGFVTKVDRERDEIAAENARLKVQKAETARDLYLKYEFPKAAEEWLSKYIEAARELTRARKAAVSRLAQAEAKWKSAQAQFSVQQRQLKEMTEQIGKCVITAQKPGLVVYGGGGDDMMYYGGEERIREGGTVRERQSIITIPDMTKMSVKVKIHESYIKQVKKGQKVRVTVDAFPDKVLGGEVTKVGVLPDSQNRWMNPDLKVYLTTLTIDGTHDWLKPGMTAKVEIIVDRLADVVFVPMQAVAPQGGKQVCYVARSGEPEARLVETGQFNDEFIEIRSGLKAGEKVLLRPRDLATGPGEGNKPPGTVPVPAAVAAPVGATAPAGDANPG